MGNIEFNVKPYKGPKTRRTAKILFVLAAITFLIFSPFLGAPKHMGSNGMPALALFLLSVALWGTKLIPPAITSMIVIVMSPLLGILDFKAVAGGLGNEVIWLIIAMLMMGTAMEEHSVDKRIAYNILIAARGSVRKTVVLFIVTSFVLTFFIPNAMGRVSVLLPIAIGLVKCIDSRYGNVHKLIMLTITFVPYITTISLITSAGGSIYAAGLFNSLLGFEWNYFGWMLLMLPIVFATLILFGITLVRMFPPEISIINGNLGYFYEERRKLGFISFSEIKLLVLYLMLFILWVTKGITHMSIAMSAVLVSILLFLPGINILEWKSTVKKIDWGIPFIFAAGFAIANTLERGGVIQWIFYGKRYVETLPVSGLVLVTMLGFILIRIGFTNYTAMVAAFLPVAFKLAEGASYNPIWFGMVCTIASSIGYLLPSQTVGGMTVFALGFYDMKDFFVTGFILTIIIMVVTLLAAFFYWPLMGLNVY
ncbi:anion permease [Metallumcola ferriviriculae]|uniref:Sodium-dependent dicarboxylate transporter SdcS n=1 Tax=Metallumcola ferriviriculae TaxID=3039180 RepID=A0AAU0UKV9_9FIRM|nr:anion permease [Desulfitibacteraceae bacterium MK1]